MFRIKLIFILLISLIHLKGFSQKENFVWKFGEYAGLDFNSGHAVSDTNSRMYAVAGCASISDNNGNLMFYTNGWTVWNKNHQVMVGGVSIATTIPLAFHQVCLIIPFPGSQTLYYIFSGGYELSNPTLLKYSIVNISHNSGLGEVISSNNTLLSDATCKLTAVLHSNGNSVWLITHKWNSSSFYSYLITKRGISLPVISSIGSYIGGTTIPSFNQKRGYLRVSPRGDKLACAINSRQYSLPNGTADNLEIFDFNRASGIVSNPISFSVDSPWGVEFSPDGSKLYYSSVTSVGQIYQINIDLNSTSAIMNSLTGLGYYGIGLQVAPDGKIYVAKPNRLFLGIIIKPNKAGLACNYMDSGIYLGGRLSRNGLPVYNQSSFYKPYFEIKNQCYGDTTYFSIPDTSRIDSVNWNFNDIKSGQLNYSNSLNPFHIFSDTGNFNVQLICYRDTIIDTINEKIRISFYPKAGFTIQDTVQCLNGNNFYFTNTSTISYGAMTYEWDLGDSTFSYNTDTVHSYLTGDSFPVKLMVLSDYGCTDTFLRKVYLLPSPSCVFSLNKAAQCFDSNSFIFTNQSRISKGTMTYNWNFGDSITSVQTNAVHHYARTDSFEVSLIALSNLGCSDTAKKQVYTYSKPKVEFTITESIQCLNGNSFSFNNLSTVDAGGLYCLWNFGDSNTTNIYNPNHSYNYSDSFSVKLIVSSDFGCKDSVSKLSIVKPSPNANFTVNDSSQCISGNLFSFKGQNQSLAIDTIKWDFGDGNSDTSAAPFHTFSTLGSFNVRLFISAVNGCSDTSIKIMLVNMPSKADFLVNDTAQCLSGNMFSFQNLTGGVLSNTLWKFGDGNSDTSANPNHQYSMEDTFQVNLIVTNQDGCKDSIIKKVTIYPKPKASFNINDSSQCLTGNTFQFNNTTTGINAHLWLFGDGQGDTNKNTSHIYSSSGKYTIILQTLNKEGCTDSLSKSIIVNAALKPDFTINDSIQCLNSNIFLFGNITTGLNKYLWEFGDGQMDTNINTSHSYSATGNFFIKLIATTTDACIDSSIKQISILSKPNTVFNVNDSIQCLNTNNFQFANLTTGASSYQWNFGDGNSDTTQNPNHIYLAAGSYNTRLISQSAGGCKDTSNITITVLEIPKAALSVNDTSQMLPGNSFVFGNLTNCKPASSTCKYLWDFGDGQNDTFSNPTHSYSTVGNYHVLLTSISGYGCRDTVSLNVFVTMIIINAAFTVDDICLGDYAYFNNNSTIRFDSFLNFLWDFGDGIQTIIMNNPSYLYADTGMYYVQMVAITYGGFRDTSSQYIRVLPSPNVNIIADPDTIAEEGIKVKLTANGVFDSILWNTGQNTATIEADKTGKYIVRVVSQNGCDASDSVMMMYLPKTPFSFMNVITPNGDGMNDMFKINQIDKYQPCKLTIYNRWGDELYSTKNYQNNWDGTFKGKDLPEGTYYFVLVAKDGKVYKGAVNILK